MSTPVPVSSISSSSILTTIREASTDSTSPLWRATTETPESRATTRSMPVPTRGESEREAASGRLVKSLQEVCAYAAEQAREYTLASSLETFDRTVDKKRLSGPTREAAAVA